MDFIYSFVYFLYITLYIFYVCFIYCVMYVLYIFFVQNYLKYIIFKYRYADKQANVFYP